MGVQGLWQVLNPCARPTNLATLNRRRLAVDASIWIYQFLKAVRDKEGNALRNSHVVGFFRRICKLLWFGIKPVFVFDGGAPALKRATIQGRRRRREGRREDAVRTAGKLLAVQMKRIAQEEQEKRKARMRSGASGEEDGVPEGEELPDVENMVYAEEAFTAKPERQKSRTFFRQDQYHLPELETNMEAMGKPDDPRIMSVEELEEYARQFNSGEDVNLYDFSKIDFDGDFFKSLPPADRYNILNAARVRSRLRMGLSKEQLDIMFPNRMDFSRFQIERVQERNRLTQRLMFEMKMTGTDLTLNGGGRIAGDKNREYILVKNDGVEGGYALGVVTQEKDLGQKHKPIDVEALQLRFATNDDDDEWEDEDDDFEDVPIEGLNRLPKPKRRVQNEDSLFVDDDDDSEALFISQADEDQLMADEDEDVARAIEMSLRNQHGIGEESAEAQEDSFDDVTIPQWQQRAVEAPKPIASTSGAMVAHIINNRANAAVPKRKLADDDSDSEEDLQAVLAAARKKKKTQPSEPKAPILPNIKNPFGGPLPFEKLDWRTSIFEKKPNPAPTKPASEAKEAVASIAETGGGFQIELPPEGEEAELDGGFEREPVKDGEPKPLPPWMIHDDTDIRDKVKEQRRAHNEVNEEDERLAREEERLRRNRQRNELIEIESSDDDDIEILEAPPVKSASLARARDGQAPALLAEASEPPAAASPGMIPGEIQRTANQVPEPDHKTSSYLTSPEVEFEDVEITHHEPATEPTSTEAIERDASAFEDVGQLPPTVSVVKEVATNTEQRDESEEPVFEDVVPPPAQQEIVAGIAPVDLPVQVDDDLFAEGEYDEFSDPEEEQLLIQMAEEAEEHGRFASELNNKPAYQNQEDYERELRALRSQQKKDRRDADEVTQIMVTECQALLRLFGIPYITAPMEAEAQCAELVHLGLVDGIVTDDSDTFLFGGTRVYKNMFNSNKFVECYLSTDLEKELSLSRQNLISVAHLLGSDYTEGIPGIGPVTAVEILSEFPGEGGLAAFREWWTEVQSNPSRPKDADAGSSFRRKFRKTNTTKVFLPPGFPSTAVDEAYLHPDVDKNPEAFQWGVPDLEGLRRFLMATIGWSQERTDEVLVPVIRDMNRRDMEGTQSNITRYFDGSVGVGAKETFAPRTKQKGSRRMEAAVSKLRANTGNAPITEEEEGLEEASSLKSTIGTRKRKTRTAVVVDSDRDDENDRDGDFVYDEDQNRSTDKAKGKGAEKGGKGKAEGRIPGHR